MQQSADDGHLFTGQTDDALHEVAGVGRDDSDEATDSLERSLGQGPVVVDVRDAIGAREHDDVTADRSTEAVRDLLDDDAVVHGERRDHRRRRDVEHLHDERAQEERDDEREGDEEREFSEVPAAAGSLRRRSVGGQAIASRFSRMRAFFPARSR